MTAVPLSPDAPAPGNEIPVFKEPFTARDRRLLGTNGGPVLALLDAIAAAVGEHVPDHRPTAGEEIADEEAIGTRAEVSDTAGAFAEVAAVDPATVELDEIFPLARLSAAEALSAIRGLESARRRIDALSTRVLGHYRRIGNSADLGYRTVEALLQGELRISVHEARRRTRLTDELAPGASLLGDRQEPVRPLIAEEYVRGRVSADEARVLCEALDTLPPHMRAEFEGEVEATLIELAPTIRLADVPRLMRRIVQTLDPDGQPPELRSEPQKHHVTLAQKANGDWNLKGLLDCPTGAVLHSLLYARIQDADAGAAAAAETTVGETGTAETAVGEMGAGETAASNSTRGPDSPGGCAGEAAISGRTTRSGGAAPAGRGDSVLGDTDIVVKPHRKAPPSTERSRAVCEGGARSRSVLDGTEQIDATDGYSVPPAAAESETTAGRRRWAGDPPAGAVWEHTEVTVDAEGHVTISAPVCGRDRPQAGAGRCPPSGERGDPRTGGDPRTEGAPRTERRRPLAEGDYRTEGEAPGSSSVLESSSGATSSRTSSGTGDGWPRPAVGDGDDVVTAGELIPDEPGFLMGEDGWPIRISDRITAAAADLRVCAQESQGRVASAVLSERVPGPRQMKTDTNRDAQGAGRRIANTGMADGPGMMDGPGMTVGPGTAEGASTAPCPVQEPPASLRNGGESENPVRLTPLSQASADEPPDWGDEEVSAEGRRGPVRALAEAMAEGAESTAADAEATAEEALGEFEAVTTRADEPLDWERETGRAVSVGIRYPGVHEDGSRSAFVPEPDSHSPGRHRHDRFAFLLRCLARERVLHGADHALVVRAQASELADPARLLSTHSGGDVAIGGLERWSQATQLFLHVVDGGGRTVQVRSQGRFATRSQMAVLSARDQGCSFPDCDHPVQWCEAHHIRPYSDGGATEIDNLTLVCPFHHRWFERSGWESVLVRGLPAWMPPAHVDPLRTPVFHSRFRTELLALHTRSE